MRRLWIGIGVLLVLLVLGIGAAALMETVPGALAQDMDRAAQEAAVQWESAKALAQSARARWEQWEHTVASLTDHAPLEELQGLFRELSVSQLWEDRGYFATVCARISALAEALSQSHSLHWWNLL